MIISRTMNIDVYMDNCVVVEAKQLDNNTRFINATITDNGMPLNLTGFKVKFYAEKPDGCRIFNDVEIIEASTGKIRIPLTSQTLAANGEALGELSVFNDDGLLTTRAFIIRINKTIRNDSAIESSDEFTALISALNEIDEAVSKVGEIEELNNILMQNINTGTDLNEDLKETIVRGNTTNGELKNSTMSGAALNTELKNNANSAEAINTDLRANINSGNSLKSELISNIQSGTTLNNDLKANITVGTTLNNNLGTNITKGKTTNTDLQNTIAEGRTLDVDLRNTISSAEHTIRYIVEAENKHFRLDRFAFKLNPTSGLWECEFKHNLGSEYVISGLYTNEWKALLPVCDVVDANTIIIKTASQITVRLILNKSFMNVNLV